ncbi:MAG: hypothetical protein PHX62_00340 [Bacilli bacterium]|nr:hypothetical protein [Bacilli bacterium]
MLCLNCLNEIKNSETCSCGSKNIFEKKDGKYLFNGQVYSKKAWLALMSDTRLQRRYLFTRRDDFFNPSYLERKFKENLRIHTFVRLFLPSVFFIVLFFLSILIYILNDNQFIKIELHQNSLVFGLFIACFLLVLGLFNFKRIFYNRIRVMAKLKTKKIYYQQIGPSEYAQIMKELKVNYKE